MANGTAASAAREVLSVPERPGAALKKLLDEISDTFELLPWKEGEPVPEAPMLVDLTDRTARIPKASTLTTGLLVFAGNDDEARLTQLDATVLLVVSPSWEPRFSAACIRAVLRSRSQLRAFVDDDDNIDDIQREVVRHAGEITSLREQLEERHLDVLVKNKELTRLNNFKAGVLKRLGDPERGYIADVQRLIKTISDSNELPATLARPAAMLKQTAQKIGHIFRPYDFYAQAELALHGKSVLAIVKSARARKLMARALIGTGATVMVVSDAATVANYLKVEGPPDVVFADWENQGVLDQIRRQHPFLHTVLLTSQPIFENNGKAMMEMPLSNVLISGDPGDTASADPVHVQELVVTAGKLLSGDIFGLEKYLAWGAQITEERVENSGQRKTLIKHVSEHARRCGLRKSYLRNMETLVDELLMNAIWDAPVDSQGKPKYMDQPRYHEVNLLPHEAATLSYGSDGNLLGIAVTDPFGRLDREHAFNYLIKCFRRGNDQIDDKAQGAGLGLYYAFLSVSTLIINVAPGVRTEVIGLVNMNLTPKEARSQTRSYHYFRAWADLGEGPSRV